MLSRMAPSSPPEKRTFHLLKTPDILCANDSGRSGSYFLGSSSLSYRILRDPSLALTGMPMNYASVALASLGATVAYFAFGFVMFAALPAMKTEFMKYPNVYRSKESMMKVMPYGMVAILISIVVVAVLYARIYSAGGGIALGASLGALIGIFAVCTFVI